MPGHQTAPPPSSPMMGGGLSPSPYGGSEDLQAGGKRHGASVKQLKRVLKKAGLKTSGRKAALTRRAKKAGLKMRGGEEDKGMGPDPEMAGGRSGKKSRSRRGKLGVFGY